jgi:3-methyl-2-oxobutanoate hydroxymethyltransferase
MQNHNRVTLQTLRQRKAAGQKIPVLTCYDYPTARILQAAGIDAVLVGDSYGQVVLGFDSTLPVTMDMMIHVTAAVRRGAPKVFLIGDMPYLSYQVDPQQAVRNAGRFMAEAGCDCVKVEVDRRLADVVTALSRATIPVMAHLGLRPQSIHQLGGYRYQGRQADQAAELIEDAHVMEQAGACALLLEALPPDPARIIAERTSLPVIGCGAGPHVDGQVVVISDVLGCDPDAAVPRFVPRLAKLHEVIDAAIRQYIDDVRAGRYPQPEHCYPMKETERLALQQRFPTPDKT